MQQFQNKGIKYPVDVMAGFEEDTFCSTISNPINLKKKKKNIKIREETRPRKSSSPKWQISTEKEWGLLIDLTNCYHTTNWDDFRKGGMFHSSTTSLMSQSTILGFYTERNREKKKNR